MILNILIPTLPNRTHSFNALVDNLQNQIIDCNAQNLVSIISNGLPSVANGGITTGEKRNRLVNSAKGTYIVFIDDDDEIPDYYIREMLHACNTESDCIAINGKMTTDGQKEIKWKLSKDYDNVTIKENGVDVYLRKTNHITAVKRELALLAPFPNKSNAEDKAYSDALNPFLKTEFIISIPMYHYRFSSTNKEY